MRQLALYGILRSNMETVAAVLPYVQVALSILLVVSILLQQRGSSLGGAFGGDGGSVTTSARRGSEKWLFRASIVLGVLFALSAFIALLIA